MSDSSKKMSLKISSYGESSDIDDHWQFKRIKLENEPLTEEETKQILFDAGANVKIEPDVDLDYSVEDEDEGGTQEEFIITEIESDAIPPELLGGTLESSSIYECDICRKRFTYLRSFNQHRMVHALRADLIKCDICGKMLKPTALDYHMNYRHIDARNFQCTRCFRRFKSPGALRQHIATFHPNKELKKFDCNKCELTFKVLDHLKKHEQAVHAPKPQERLSCQYCSKQFENKQKLTLHIGIFGKKLGKCRDTM